MGTLLGPSVWGEITAQAKSAKKPAFAAVAYFSEAGDQLLPLPSDSILVVDASLKTVEAGATCPAALRKLLKRGAKVFSAQNLHAKVFAFDAVAFVGSANASTRSQKHLIEAVLKTTDAAIAAEVRTFVQGLAITALSDADLVELQKSYKPPKLPKIPQKKMPLSTLLMELTKEQGVGRETQVQPPKPVWETYFGVKFGGPYPLLQLTLTGAGPAVTYNHRPVKHDHNLTIELPGANTPRPAILEIRRRGANAYEYAVRRPADPQFAALKTLLENVKNPLWTSGRKWHIV